MKTLFKVLFVGGARPNFMKLAPVFMELKRNENIKCFLCHTGQHYDENMSNIFIKELRLPKPDFYLGIGSGTHSEQTGKIMIEFEKLLFKLYPDLVIVVGDVNSTLACSLASVKCGVKVAHIEAGLRSFDRTMPEEINRLLTDAVSDYLFVTEKSGINNLKNEGISINKIFFVGNTMIDSLCSYINKTNDKLLRNFNLEKGKYILVTMHRPFIVDNLDRLQNFIKLLIDLSAQRKIIFPLHPRTRKNLEGLNNLKALTNIYLSEPFGYLDFITFLKNAELVITDSGGIQEESTFLGVQCVTIRDNTERPVTVEIGTNHLAGTNMDNVRKVIYNILKGEVKIGRIPELWDGKAAKRIVKILMQFIY